MILAWSGFAVGQILGDWLGLSFGRLGTPHIGLATIGSLMFLVLGYWLSKTPENK